MFGKRGPDVIDYTLLEKRGIIKKKEPEKVIGKVGGDGFISLNGNDVNAVLNAKASANPVKRALAVRARTSEFNRALVEQQTQTSTANSGSLFAALDNSADASSQQSQTSSSFFDSFESSNSNFSSPGISSPNNSDSDIVKQLNHLQVKLEDLEYKFERLLERLDTMGTSS